MGVNEHDVEARISLAEFYAKKGDRTRALEHLGRLASDIADPHVLVFGAVAFMDLADRGEALTWLERAAAHA